MSDEDETQSKWLAVIAKALCYICLQQAKLNEILEKVEFLQKLGLDRTEAAQVVGSTAGSIAVLRHRAKKRGKDGKAKKKKKKTRR
jgi:hypothetical protein